MEQNAGDVSDNVQDEAYNHRPGESPHAVYRALNDLGDEKKAIDGDVDDAAGDGGLVVHVCILEGAGFECTILGTHVTAINCLD